MVGSKKNYSVEHLYRKYKRVFSPAILNVKILQTVSIAFQQSSADAIHARFLHLEEYMALIPPSPSRALLSSSELNDVASFG